VNYTHTHTQCATTCTSSQQQSSAWFRDKLGTDTPGWVEDSSVEVEHKVCSEEELSIQASLHIVGGLQDTGQGVVGSLQLEGVVDSQPEGVVGTAVVEADSQYHSLRA